MSLAMVWTNCFPGDLERGRTWSEYCTLTATTAPKKKWTRRMLHNSDVGRSAVLKRWVVFLSHDMACSAVGRDALEDANPYDALHCAVQDIFAGKSTATLLKRVQSNVSTLGLAPTTKLRLGAIRR
eukprot:6459370-Amphidinium_carterae.1